MEEGKQEASQFELEFMEWSDQQDIDPNNPHRQRSADTTSVVLNNRFYLFQNLTATNPHPVKVVDPSLCRLFNIDLIGEGNKVTESARINYSICASASRVFLYGGVNEKSQVLGSMD